MWVQQANANVLCYTSIYFHFNFMWTHSHCSTFCQIGIFFCTSTCGWRIKIYSLLMISMGFEMYYSIWWIIHSQRETITSQGRKNRRWRCWRWSRIRNWWRTIQQTRPPYERNNDRSIPCGSDNHPIRLSVQIWSTVSSRGLPFGRSTSSN